MPQQEAKVTVLMPVYNMSEFIGEALESVLSQTMKDFELLIIDDGSTDDTMKVISSYQDSRIRVLQNEKNMGLIFTLNKGLKEIKTPYICRADADDICEPNRLALQYQLMEGNKKIGFCSSYQNLFEKSITEQNPSGHYTPIKHEHIIVNLFFCKSWGALPMLRKEVLDKHDFSFDPEQVTSEDYDLFIKLSKVSQMENIPKTLYHYRQHSQSICALNRQKQRNAYKKLVSREIKLFYPQITKQENEMHLKIVFDEKIQGIKEVTDALNHLEKLKALNRKNQVFEPNYFESYLRNWGQNIVLNNTKSGLKIFFLYQKFSLKINVGLKNKMNFFLDCLFKRKNKYIN